MSSPNARALIDAFRHAVDGEKRWGARIDPEIVADLDARWLKVVELIQTLWRKK